MDESCMGGLFQHSNYTKKEGHIDPLVDSYTSVTSLGSAERPLSFFQRIRGWFQFYNGFWCGSQQLVQVLVRGQEQVQVLPLPCR